MQKKKTVISILFWDLGNVLVKLDFDQLFQKICPLLDTTSEGFHEILFSSNLFQACNTGEITPENFHQKLMKAMKRESSFQDFKAAWCSFFLPDPDMGQLLHDLTKNDLPMWLLSNTDPLHHHACQKKYSYLKYLTGQLTSYQLKAMKPDAILYKRALDYTKSLPEQVLFFDDKPENIAGARSLGMHAHLFESPDQCVDILKTYNLLSSQYTLEKESYPLD